MSENNSLKRSCEEITEETKDSENGVPESKQFKIDEQNSEHNLKKESVIRNNTETRIFEENNEKNDGLETEKVVETVVHEEIEQKLEISGESSIFEETSKIEVSTKETEAIACSISIKFQNEEIAKLYKSKFKQFLNSFPELQVQDDNLTINVYSTGNTDEIEDTTPKKRKKHSKVKKELFVVDATPSLSTSKNDLRYTTKFTISTDKIVEEVIQNAKSACFNCDGDHALKDCRHPKNRDKINEARQKFRIQNKSARYHLEADQKYSYLKPGQISVKLRKALGLHKNEAPPYIYLMRQLGYPPGWLEEAKVENSNLDMYIDGNVKSVPNQRKNGLDENKVVEYPGFNAPFQRGIRDDYRNYGVPPYSENQSKQAMIDYFNKNFVQEEDNLETCDMDVDCQPESSNTEKNIENYRNSPTLTDLEQQKRQLLEELNEEPKKEAVSDANKEFLTVKTTSFGTPILKSNSPYSSLPNPDNFSKDVSPVINFENLPNSTGKYEQLTNVLEKVRSTMKKINSCNT